MLATFDDNGSIVVGATNGYEGEGRGNVLIRRFNADGSERWSKTILGDADSAEVADSVATLPDGSAIVTGTFRTTITLGAPSIGTRSTVDGSYDNWVIRATKAGQNDVLRRVKSYSGSSYQIVVHGSTVGFDTTYILNLHSGGSFFRDRLALPTWYSKHTSASISFHARFGFQAYFSFHVNEAERHVINAERQILTPKDV